MNSSHIKVQSTFNTATPLPRSEVRLRFVRPLFLVAAITVLLSLLCSPPADAASGPTGPTGPTGAKGATGAGGGTGATGPNGATGLSGIIGDAGATGATGPDNFTAGATGAAGAVGPVGAVGPNGATGANGATGISPTGPTGGNGFAGATGPVGASGNNGATGAIGATGSTGSPGLAGATGPRGAIGLAGPAGSLGNAGPPGPAGPTGPTGPNGDSTQRDDLQREANALRQAAVPPLYATGSNLVILDPATNTTLATLGTPSGLFGIAINHAGTRVYATDRLGNKVYVFDTATRTLVGSPIAVSLTPTAVVVSPDDRYIYVCNDSTPNQSSSQFNVIDTKTNSVTSASIGAPSYRGAMMPDGNAVWLLQRWNPPNLVNKYNTTNRTAPSSGGSASGPLTPGGLAINPAGTRLYVSGTASDGQSYQVWVIDLTNGSFPALAKIRIGFGAGSAPIALALNAAGTRFYAASVADQAVYAYDTATNTLLGTANGITAQQGSIALNPAGTRIDVALINSISVIDATTMSVVGTIPVSGNPAGVASRALP